MTTLRNYVVLTGPAMLVLAVVALLFLYLLFGVVWP